jgi:hypothetical protein
MDTKRCEKCSEVVDVAKAFCPSCGDAFVTEETREKASEFEASAGTVQYSSSLFNQLLSDLDLDISETPEKPAPTKSVDLKLKKPQNEEIPPVSGDVARAGKSISTEKSSGSRRKWLIIGGIALSLIVLLALLLVIAGIILYLYFYRSA